MVFKLYGHPLSSAVLRVAVVLHEKQVPFEMILVDIAGKEHKSAEYMEKHPFGQIPYIGTQLIPSGTNALAIFEQTVSVETVNFDPTASQIIFQKFFSPKFELPVDEEAYEKALEKLNGTFAVYEKILSKQKYLAGNEVTLVNLFHLPGLHLSDKIGSLSLEDKPNVARWYKEISTRPSWGAVKDKMIQNNMETFTG